MLLAQAPLPPIPPVPPLPLGVAGADGPAMVMIALAVCLTLGVLFRPLVRAWARRLEGRGADADMIAELHELRVRVGELEGQQSRLTDLEERLDFAERLVSQQERVQIARETHG
jgi:hypothetical protein